MKFFDISHGVQSAPIYPGSAEVTVDPISRIEDGNSCNMSLITAESHMGTHADAICHFIHDGTTIDKMDISHYIGPCTLLQVKKNCAVTPAMLLGRLEGVRRLVLACGKGGWLGQDTAEMLVNCGLRTIVTEGMSVGEMDNEAAVHRILLGAGIAVIENVHLENLQEGEYMLSALPIKYEGGDGAPVRAVLWQDCE